jgi:hypothetical protein
VINIRIPWNKGLVTPDEVKKKISVSNKKVIHTDEWNKKVSVSKIGHEVSEKTRLAVSLAHKGKKSPFKILREKSYCKRCGKELTYQEFFCSNSCASKSRVNNGKGVKKSINAIRHMRLSVIDRISRQKCNGLPMMPSIGKHETNILDLLENNIGYKIERQKFCDGYFIDGYCKELNLVIEVNERHHFNDNGEYNDRHLRRKNDIVTILNCQWLDVKA